eukprot:6173786-Pleurochrysis_carterae.AAC.2
MKQWIREAGKGWGGDWLATRQQPLLTLRRRTRRYCTVSACAPFNRRGACSCAYVACVHLERRGDGAVRTVCPCVPCIYLFIGRCHTLRTLENGFHESATSVKST